jgi:hypothetical protein
MIHSRMWRVKVGAGDHVRPRGLFLLYIAFWEFHKKDLGISHLRHNASGEIWEAVWQVEQALRRGQWKTLSIFLHESVRKESLFGKACWVHGQEGRRMPLLGAHTERQLNGGKSLQYHCSVGLLVLNHYSKNNISTYPKLYVITIHLCSLFKSMSISLLVYSKQGRRKQC